MPVDIRRTATALITVVISDIGPSPLHRFLSSVSHKMAIRFGAARVPEKKAGQDAADIALTRTGPYGSTRPHAGLSADRHL